MQIGRLDAIWRYPTKSLHFESLDAADVDADGIRGDRERALVVTDGHARLGKPYRGTENDRFHLVSDDAAARALAAERGVQTEVRGGRFFDAAPVSILVDSWLEGLCAHVGYAVEPHRFRPNLFVRAADGFALLEDDLAGWELSLGPVRLRVREPIERCVVTTYDPGGGASDPRILRYVAQERKTWMGIYCDVVTPGVIRPGDELLRVLPDA
ncbi:MAG TPA: MOSC domain-containing protein [Candidatus Acidoferrales bacterium]|jgi:uncharacterized protein YcbX|nr:MOSC domain-containing protein [Candidatus Acidoferrales bacterium]